MEQLIDSSSVGDEARFQPAEVLEAHLASLSPAPRDAGRVRLLVKKHTRGRRDTPPRAFITAASGRSDATGRQPLPALEAPLTVMQADVAELIANGQPLALFGDNLFLELDLSAANLPPGSRLRAGTATLEVAPKPHDGCRKFRARFGDGALRLVSRRDLRHLNLRGVYMRVVEDGEIAAGDPVVVLSRPVSTRP